MCFEGFFNVLDVISRSTLGLALGFWVGQYLANQKYIHLPLFYLYMLRFKLQDGTWVHMCWCSSITVHTYV